VTENELMQLIAAERRELGSELAALPAARWDEPTLCDGWRVRELVAHMTMPFRYSTWQFFRGMVAAGGRFATMADRVARRDAARMSSGELTESVSDNADFLWKPPGGGLQGALSHDVIHGLDFAVALDIDRTVPADRLRPVLDGMSNDSRVRYFKADLDGVRLQADDLDWGFGSGSQVRGRAQDLLLVVCGRKLPAGRLSGGMSSRFLSTSSDPAPKRGTHQ
jgi:uncharacterized protein (TIGR03083 family)